MSETPRPVFILRNHTQWFCIGVWTLFIGIIFAISQADLTRMQSTVSLLSEQLAEHSHTADPTPQATAAQSEAVDASLIKGMGKYYAIYSSIWLLGLSGIGVGFMLLQRREAKTMESFLALEQSEQKFRFYFEHAPIAYQIMSPAGEMLAVNNSWCELTGWTGSESRGANIRTLIPASEHPKLDRHLNRLMEFGSGPAEEFLLQKKDGSRILVSASARAEKSGKTGRDKIHWVLLDVTTQNQTRDALLESEAKYRLIADHSNDIIWIYNLETDRCEYVSPSTIRLLGIPADQAVGRSIFEFLTPDSLTWVKAEHERRLACIKAGDTSLLNHLHEVEILHASGVPMPFEVASTILLGGNGTPTRMIGVCRDIGRRRQYEQALNSLVVNTGPDTGDEFLQPLMRDLSRVLGMQSMLLIQYNAGSTGSVRRILVLENDCVTEALDLQVQGPCLKRIHEEGMLECWAKMPELFPGDPIIRRFSAQACLGIPLAKKDGSLIGVLIALHGMDAMHNPSLPTLFRIFAARAAAEIERHDALSALADREERIRNIIENTQAGYARTDRQGRYVDINQAWLDLHGFNSPDEVLGKDFSLTQVTDDLPLAKEIRERILRGEKVQPGEFSRLRKDGSIGQHTFSFSPVYEDGRIIGTEGFFIDTTLLRKAQADAAMLFNEMIDGFALCEMIKNEAGVPIDYRYLAVNPAFERITGITADKVIGHNAKEVFPELEAYWIERYARVALNGEQLYFEDYMKPLGKHLSISAFQPIPNRFACVFIDVTARKMAEEQLACDEAELAAIHEHVPMMLILLDQHRRIRRFNRAAAQFAEFSGTASSMDSPGLLLGCINAVNGDQPCGSGKNCSLCPLRIAITDTLKTGTRHQHEESSLYLFRGERPEETVLSFSTASVLVGGESLVLLCLEDITAHKQTEARIRRQAALLDITRDAICVLNNTGTIEFWNLGAERIFGWTGIEAVSADLETLIFRKQSPELQDCFEKTRGQGEWMGELRATNKAGTQVILQCRGTSVPAEKGLSGSMLLVCTDVTETRRIEQQFLRMQRLDNLGSITSGIAHDLNNILSPILMSADLLPPLLSSPEHQPLLQMLRDSAKRGADIVRQLLVFSRGNETPRKILEVGQLISEMAIMITQTFPRNIRYSSSVAPGLWSIKGDATQIHQVLLNLCVNARDAMPSGGRLVITAENTTINAAACSMHPDTSPGPFICIQVSDTGTGIPPEILDKIFDPFFTTKASGKGTGLGLSTVLAIIKSHNGFMTVNSHQGTGTDFKVLLPAIPQNKCANPETDIIQDLKGAGQTILVIDDEVNMRDLMLMVLKSHNYHVILASDGAQGLDAFASSAPNISAIFVDMMMPHMDGRLCIECIREMNEETPIIAMSGMMDQGPLIEKMNLSRLSFLLKPFSIQKLLTILRDTLSEASANVPRK